MTSSGADRFRNYGDVLQRHEQEMRIKRIIRVFTLFAVILILVVLIVIVARFENEAAESSLLTTKMVSMMKCGAASTS